MTAQFSRNEEDITFRDRFGYTKKLDGKSGTLHFIDYPARSNDAWPGIRDRLILEDDDVSRVDVKG